MAALGDVDLSSVADTSRLASSSLTICRITYTYSSCKRGLSEERSRSTPFPAYTATVLRVVHV